MFLLLSVSVITSSLIDTRRPGAPSDVSVGDSCGMDEFHPIPAEQFLAQDPRRQNSRQWDHGHFSDDDHGRRSLLTWIEATQEVCALVGGGRYPEAFILLGRAPTHRCLEAVLENRPDHEASIAWVAEMLDGIPADPEDVRSLVAAYDSRVRAEAENEERRYLESFEVVELSSLPETDRKEAIRYADEDWAAIATVAVELLASGVSPRDEESILERGGEVLSDSGCGLLGSLFGDPIAIPREGTAFINGRHRTAAMRAAGVPRCVVHIDRGGA